jgi:hypothetical protein
MSPKTFEIEKISSSEFSKLDGEYRNQMDSLYGRIEHSPYRGVPEDRLKLCDRLFLIPPDSGYYQNVVVRLEFISRNKANVKVRNDQGLISSKSIKGKFKNGYFYLRPKGFIIPFFPIYYHHNFERARIGKSVKGLIVDHTINSWGFALFAGSSDFGRSTSTYKEVNE